jgi:hypothetical protein
MGMPISFVSSRFRIFGALLFLCMAALEGSGAEVRSEPLSWTVPSGLRDEPAELRITHPSAAARIFYTRDGSVPTVERGHPLTGPVVITTTTLIRAAAFEGGRGLSEVETRSFIFPADVPSQTGNDFPPTWGTRNEAPVPAYYAMEVEDGANRSQVVAGLRALPSLSVVLEPGALFLPERGIYANPLERGGEWERLASVEYFPTSPRPGFQIDCGIRIQGGWNRRPEESPKHAFRLAFRKKYGAGKLHYPLFDGTAPVAFDDLILRAGCNNTWLHWSGEERQRGEYLRDQWMRDTYRAMGHVSARGEFVHLYLNGIYWGIYNLTERPDAEFAAAHLGGKAADYDSRNADNILEGDTAAWETLFTLANSGLADPARYARAAELLNMPAFADYMIVNLYGANADWDRSSNWYAARHRAPGGKFHFFVWDAERTLEFPNDNSMAFDDDQSPSRLFHKLRENESFRKLFAERARVHLTGSGVLTPEAAAVRYRAGSGILERAIVCEAARWGAYRKKVHQYKTGPYETYTRERHWNPEVARLLSEYFPRRTVVVIEQFRSAGLFE